MKALKSLAKSALAVACLLALAGSGAAAADDGAQLYEKNCVHCHSLDVGRNGIGPSLAGIFGRNSAAQAGYHYSQVMRAAHLTWDEETLKKYLTGPQALIPCHAVRVKALVQCNGIKMTFRGFRNSADAQAVIDFLKTR